MHISDSRESKAMDDSLTTEFSSVYIPFCLKPIELPLNSGVEDTRK